VFSKLFGGRAPDTEYMDGPFWKTVRADGSDFVLSQLRFEPSSLVTVTPRRKDFRSYIIAARAPGDAIDSGGWERGARLLALRGRPAREFPGDDRLSLFEKVFVQSEEPSWRAYGPNGIAVERFLSELLRRGQVDAVDRIRSKAWLDCMGFLDEQQHDANANAVSRAAWDAAFALASKCGTTAACNAATEIAKETAMKAAHLSEPADARAAAFQDSEAWKTADETITVRMVGFQWSPLYRGEKINVAAGLTAERAVLAIVMQTQLAPDLFEALTAPMRSFVDPELFGALPPTTTV